MNKLLFKVGNGSFRLQILFGTILIISTLVVGFTYTIINYQSTFLHKQALKQAQNRSKTLALSSKVWILSNDYEGLEEVIHNFAAYDDTVFSAVIDLDGKIIAHSDVSLIGKFIADEKRLAFLQEEEFKGLNHEKILFQNESYIDIIRVIHEKNLHIGFVNLRIKQNARQENISNTITKGVLFTIVAILISILFAYIASRTVVTQLLGLVMTMREVKDGNKSVRASEDTVSEIAELSKEFNTMLQELSMAENLYKSLHERLELSFSGTQDGLWDWNLLDDSVYFSPLWKNMLGYEDSEIENILASWSQRVHPDDLKNAMLDIQNHLDGKTPVYQSIHRVQHKDGKWLWILDRGKALFDEDGKAIRMVGTHTDITQEKEKQLKYEHQAQIIQQTVDAIISTDIEGNIIDWNNGSESLLGFSSQEVMGKNIDILYSKYDREFLKASPASLIENGEFSTDTNFITKSKKPLSVTLSLTLLRDEKEEPISIIYYAKDITERKNAERELKHQKDILDYQAHHDSLTDLPNRLLFYERLAQAIVNAEKTQQSFAVLFIDLDRFKEINDSLGHISGDKVLEIIGERLSKIIGKESTLARLGGDEFTILKEKLLTHQEASILAIKILKSFEEPIDLEGTHLYISSSIGISLFPQDDRDAINLLKYADVAMYKAKDEGRNTFQFYSSEMTEKALEHISLGRELQEALINNEFEVYYQPQTDGVLDKMIGMEALVRWRHPKKGLIAPGLFIPFAEETGLIVKLDRVVMRTAMLQWVKWYAQGFTPGVLSLNLSMKQLQKEDFIPTLKAMMQETGCKEKWLELEVTEGQIMKHPEDAIIKLKEISKMGIELAIDDFGTGYSSLSYLKRLPINKLKIDQSFIQGIPEDEEDVGITKAVIDLSKSLKLSVIAEGVETKEQRDFLVQNGCVNIQGYYYSKPIPQNEMEALLKKLK